MSLELVLFYCYKLTIMESAEPTEPKVAESNDRRSTVSGPGQYDYFIEGYDLPQEERVIRDRLLTHVPTLKTRSYRVVCK
jgi:hypothetical protein